MDDDDNNLFIPDSFDLNTSPTTGESMSQPLFSPLWSKYLNSPSSYDPRFSESFSQGFADLNFPTLLSPKSEPDHNNINKPLQKTKKSDQKILKKKKKVKKPAVFKPFTSFDSLELSVKTLNQFKALDQMSLAIILSNFYICIYHLYPMMFCFIKNSIQFYFFFINQNLFELNDSFFFSQDKH